MLPIHIEQKSQTLKLNQNTELKNIAIKGMSEQKGRVKSSKFGSLRLKSATNATKPGLGKPSSNYNSKGEYRAASQASSIDNRGSPTKKGLLSSTEVQHHRSQRTIAEGQAYPSAKARLGTTIGSHQANRSMQRQSSNFTGRELRSRQLIGSSLVKNITSTKQSLWVVQATVGREHAKSHSAFPQMKLDPSKTYLDPPRPPEILAKT